MSFRASSNIVIKVRKDKSSLWAIIRNACLFDSDISALFYNAPFLTNDGSAVIDMLVRNNSSCSNGYFIS